MDGEDVENLGMGRHIYRPRLCQYLSKTIHDGAVAPFALDSVYSPGNRPLGHLFVECDICHQGMLLRTGVARLEIEPIAHDSMRRVYDVL